MSYMTVGAWDTSFTGGWSWNDRNSLSRNLTSYAPPTAASGSAPVVANILAVPVPAVAPIAATTAPAAPLTPAVAIKPPMSKTTKAVIGLGAGWALLQMLGK